MAPRRQITPLFTQCVDHIVDSLDHICATHVANPGHPHLFTTAQYLHQLPVHLQAILGGTLLERVDRRQHNLSPAQIQLLLSLRVRDLSITGSAVRSGVLDVADGSHLSSLSLGYAGCGNTKLKLRPFLQSVCNLTFLKCTNFCDDTMLGIISETCGRLYCLDVSCCEVTDEGILRLCGLKTGVRECIEVLSKGGIIMPTSLVSNNLRELKLAMTNITEAGIAVILLILRKIELLRVPDIKVEKTFNFLQTINHKGIQFNLKEFHSREILDEIQLQVLTEVCPNLEYIQMSFLGSTEMDLPRMRILTNLTKLKRAKIADISIDALIQGLEVFGHRMVHLYLYTYHTRFAQEKLSISRSHIQQIAKYCPNLENFHLEGYCLEDSTNSPRITPDTQYFKTLQSLQLISMKLSEEDLKVFLLKSNSIRILELVLGNDHVLHDNLINDLLNAGVWRNLIKIRIVNSQITRNVMSRLIGECPTLKEIGCIGTWLVCKPRISEFREVIKHDNLDITVY